MRTTAATQMIQSSTPMDSPASRTLRPSDPRDAGVIGTLPRSLLDLQHLVRRGALVRQLPLAVRQDHLDVHLSGLAQPEVGVGRLPRGVAVARGDLAAA